MFRWRPVASPVVNYLKNSDGTITFLTDDILTESVALLGPYLNSAQQAVTIKPETSGDLRFYRAKR